jgi:hypothetical protein
LGETRQCKGIKVGGGRCSARAQEVSEHCWNHDPARAEKRKKKASAGGRMRRRRPPDELEEVKRQVKVLIKSVLDGSLD